MKKLISTIAILVFAVIFTNDANAQKFRKLDKSPADIVLSPTRGADKVLKIVYSRPQLDGRSLDKLAPNGKVWRTGANEASQITFYKDVSFGGEKIKAGTYSLFTIPGEKEWTIIINSATNDWGAFSYNKDKDVARVKATVTKAADSIEAFSIAVQDGKLYLGWANTIVSVPVK
ncbi:DUF2911 domain-containing protein [Flavobacteriaceae bacterium S356]|uniref:DUF2911 domain-containing protein n=1 Tax=Asprobacillus argus TaxID=3076534 RepID=A0ABU3LCS0_9FLAO|nr:DUF2911 domain-containing protein [Flavobacteriaceae bacterium S356]